MTVPPQPPPGGWQPPQPGGYPPQQPYPQQPYPQQPQGHPHQQPYPQQPPQGYPQQPQAWHQQPPPPPVTKRIPEDQPFVARHSVKKRVLLVGGIFGGIAFVLAACIGVSSGEALVALATFGCFAAFFGLVFGLQIWLLASGGPVLAIGPAGLWIKTRPTRGQAIWLPWEAIERVYQRRWAFDKNLCVKPRDPRTGANLGAFTALDSGMQQMVFGTGFTAPLNFADRPEAEIIAAVAHFSGGRMHVT
ncbi:hypothetical protein ACTMTJ_01800 [Phytohabitans sp. LJ34]|uniref:hypothetical protein n=1 Tax=Phytohabitans sp. LJ34 TaxID=3452217 RepID=UPI003F88F239